MDHCESASPSPAIKMGGKGMGFSGGAEDGLGCYKGFWDGVWGVRERKHLLLSQGCGHAL